MGATCLRSKSWLLDADASLECFPGLLKTDSPSNRTNMKRKQITAMWAVGLAISLAPIVPAQSFDVLGMQTDPNRIETRDQASKLPMGTMLTFRCARCGAAQSMVVDEQQRYLAWFQAPKGKKCPGPCGGLVNYVSRATPAGRDYPDTFNTCSRCRRPTISWTVSKARETQLHHRKSVQLLIAHDKTDL